MKAYSFNERFGLESRAVEGLPADQDRKSSERWGSLKERAGAKKAIRTG